MVWNTILHGYKILPDFPILHLVRVYDLIGNIGEHSFPENQFLPHLRIVTETWVIDMDTILLIEDNLELLENLTELLESENYRVVMASNGYDGLNIASQVIPDLIISDIMMSGMDGYEVLDKLSKHLRTRTIPFIFITAKAEKIEKKFGLDLGADDYLIKPISAEGFFAAVENCLLKKNKLTLKFNEDLEELDGYIWSKRQIF
jgi:CheY-like chemotaxis protein